MRQSNKAVVSVLGAIAIAIVFLGAMGRIALSQADNNEFSFSDKEPINIEELVGFTEVQASGEWEVELVQSDAWLVELSPSVQQRPSINVHVIGKRLILKNSSSLSWFGGDSDATVRVYMPALEKLRLSGAVEGSISGFEGDHLDLKASGAVEFDALSGSYNSLNIDTSGAAEIDFKNLVTTDVKVDLSGAAELVLYMNGGTLDGSISGAGEIDYYGEVSSESIKVSGAGDITHRK